MAHEGEHQGMGMTCWRDGEDAKAADDSSRKDGCDGDRQRQEQQVELQVCVRPRKRQVPWPVLMIGCTCMEHRSADAGVENIT